MTVDPPATRSSAPGGTSAAVACVNAVLLAVLDVAQWIGWGGVTALRAAGASGVEVVSTTAFVLTVNLVCGLVLVLVVFAVVRPVGRSWPVRALGTLAPAVGAAVVRYLALRPVGDPVDRVGEVVDVTATALGYGVAVVAGLLVGDVVHRFRAQVRRRAEVERHASQQVARLEAEEAIRRRVLADRLHGTVQNRLVLVAAGLDHVADAIEDDLPALVDPDRGTAHAREVADRIASRVTEVRELAATLDEVREQDVRSLSHDLFPPALGTGIARAVGVLLDRLPPTLSGHLVVGPAYRAMTRARGGTEPVALADRLVVVDVVEEALTNAVKHADARRVTVELDVRDPDPPTGPGTLRLAVTNDGEPLAGPPVLCGLDRLRARAEAKGGRLELRSTDDGTVLVLEIPRREDPSDMTGA